MHKLEKSMGSDSIDFRYQANSIKSKHVLSLFYLGCKIILQVKDQMKSIIIQSVANDFPNFSEA